MKTCLDVIQAGVELRALAESAEPLANLARLVRRAAGDDTATPDYRQFPYGDAQYVAAYSVVAINGRGIGVLTLFLEPNTQPPPAASALTIARIITGRDTHELHVHEEERENFSRRYLHAV